MGQISRQASISSKTYQEKFDENLKQKNRGPTIGIRHAQVFLLFLLNVVISGMRYSISVGVIAMTDSSTSSNPDVKTYNWNNKNIILSSFYWGYVLLQMFAAELMRFFGIKTILIISMFINSASIILIPYTVEQFGSIGVIACRVVQGLFQGGFFPAMYSLLGKWSPAEERSMMTAVASSGGIIGIIVTMPLTGLICASSYGWPAAYYFYGSIGLIWIVIFFIFGAESPQHSKIISESERQYIIMTGSNKEADDKGKLAPWKDIIRSAPVRAATIAQIGLRWVELTILTEMPLYMNGVLGFDIKSNGFQSAVPYIVSLFVCLPCGSLSDYIIKNGYLSKVATRKVFATISTTGMAAALLCLSFLPTSTTIAMSMLILAVGADSISYGGAIPNIVELAPNYSGIIMAICNSFANISSICAPLVVQAIVTDESDKSQWSIIFCIGALFCTISNAYFLFYASGDVQSWNDGECQKIEAENKEKGNHVINVI